MPDPFDSGHHLHHFTGSASREARAAHTSLEERRQLYFVDKHGIRRLEWETVGMTADRLPYDATSSHLLRSRTNELSHTGEHRQNLITAITSDHVDQTITALAREQSDLWRVNRI